MLPEYSELRPAKPLLVWDGQCGFCKYWVTRWKILTGDVIRYVPYQEIYTEINDIPKEAFKKAVRMISREGKVHSGAEAVYKTLVYTDKWKGLYGYYHRSPVFKKISDQAYNFIADHRQFMYKVTKTLFGEDPAKMKPYWVFYLAAVILLFFLIN